MAKLNKIKKDAGFSMAEVLAVVAILTILMALVTPNVIRLQSKLRQMELDAKAETIYLAVQSEMSRMRAGGPSDQYRLETRYIQNIGGAERTSIPSDIDPTNRNRNLVYITSQDLLISDSASDTEKKINNIAKNIMNESVVDATLLSNRWVIEYEPSGGYVYGVFYSEADDDNNQRRVDEEYVSAWWDYDNLRDKDQRISDDSRIGYYGGDAASVSASSSESSSFKRTEIHVINGEKLYVEFVCEDAATLTGLEYEITLSDGLHTREWKVLDPNDPFKKTIEITDNVSDRTKVYTYRINLDDLSSEDTRFVNVLGGADTPSTTSDDLVPGADLTISFRASARVKGTTNIKNGSADTKTNSLFAYDPDQVSKVLEQDDCPITDSDNVNNASVADVRNVAIIRCARHLQNLDIGSGVTTDVKMAIQDISSIYMSTSSNKSDGWIDYYGGGYYNGTIWGKPNFKPITNDTLVEYNGHFEPEGDDLSELYISGLNISATGYAGLFRSLNDITLKNINLTGSRIHSLADAAGALAGNVSGDNKIDNCYVYLTPADIQSIEEINKDRDYYSWVDGQNAGGLVGSVSNGAKVDISSSMASTIISSTGKSGGLVGAVDTGANVSILKSYTDSYIKGVDVGGLACGDISSAANCYTAGFLGASDSSAGFVNGTVQTSLKACYTICGHEPASNNTFCYSTCKAVNNAAELDRVYFLQSNTNTNIEYTSPLHGITAEDLLLSLNNGNNSTGEFEAADKSEPYNLRHSLGLMENTYRHPELKGMLHHGDWQADFLVGALVYYEQYNDKTYGFFGANVSSTLKDTGIVIGDGYGVVYKDTPPASITITLSGREPEDIDKEENITVEGTDGSIYYIYPISKGTVNALPDTIGFDINSASKRFYTKAVISTSDGHEDYYFFNPYFAKAVGALTSIDDDVPIIGEKDAIFIRTPRHLYNMSLWYDDYFCEPTRDVTYVQERDVDYALYDWKNFSEVPSVGTDTPMVSSQKPIGRTEQAAFSASFTGENNRITDISFVSKDEFYVGLFGYNKGTIRNVVLVTDYDPDSGVQYITQRTDGLEANDVVSIGVLTGYNVGVIDNCAVAGYYVSGVDGTLHAYRDSVLYAGGLVGFNAGTVKNSQADCPAMRLSSSYANAFMGGFIGKNTGSIVDCYDLGHLEVEALRGAVGDVSAAGFAASNAGGRIEDCYCATAIVINGEAALSYGFSPKEGYTNSNCYYLDKGSYHFINDFRGYNSVGNLTNGKPATYNQLRSYGHGSYAASSGYHPNTDEESYPFRAVVKDDKDRRVHYGDWMTVQALGDLGMFYWEHEEHGTNNGYHITYVGVSADGKDVCGSTLCTAHDDGGVITSYGYGYYVNKDLDNVTLESEGIAFKGKSAHNTGVANALKSQMEDYVFYPFTTRVANSGDYIYLYDTNNPAKNADLRYGTWKLKVDGTSEEYTYRFTPFFANAIQSVDSRASKLPEDGTVNYTKVPGTEDNPFEIRNVDQFRYINWNSSRKNCDTLVYGVENETNSGNYRYYPFLQYATIITTGYQSKADAYNSNRTKQYWLQSHDIRALNTEGKPRENITPVAGMATSTQLGSNKNIMFAWFGGSYDGQSYKIQNVDVVSEAYTVGLFGTVAGADIKNVIMYANDGEAKVQRDTANKTATRVTDNTTLDFETRDGAYSVGGLVGFAYEYYTKVAIDNKISNCAIAGYKVQDSSTNRQGAGTANVGGLMGFANINIENCSSVADVIIDCTHNHGHMKYGSQIRVGGIAGAAGCDKKNGAYISITNCYTGGSISATRRTLDEMPLQAAYTNHRYVKRDKESNPYDGYTCNIFASGITSGSFAPNISNFNGSVGDYPDGRVNIKNCYTYLQLPDLEGTVRAVSLIANKGDRFCLESEVIVTNCYYLDSIIDDIGHPKQNDPSTWPKYFFKPTENRVDWSFWDGFLSLFGGSNKHAPSDELIRNMIADPVTYSDAIDKYGELVISEDEFTQMLNGNLLCLRELFYSGNNKNQDQGVAAPKAISFSELSEIGDRKLNSGVTAWGYVTKTEPNGAAVDGKYSFSSEEAQDGKNYPFPTVLTQIDNNYNRSVNVHYGSWPLDGYHWGKGRDTMDIFDDMTDSGWAVKTFKLYYNEPKNLDIGDFKLSNNNRASVLSVEKASNGKYYNVRIRAVSNGSVTITEKQSGASFVLTITAKVNISCKPNELSLIKDAAQIIQLKAFSNNNATDLTDHRDGTWNLSPGDESKSSAFTFTQDEEEPGKWSVIGREAGDRSIAIKYVFDYHSSDGGKKYSSTIYVPARILGYIGLTNGTAEKKVVSTRKLSGSHTGSANSSVLPDCPAGPELFLFGNSGDGDLGDFSIESVSVGSTTLTNNGSGKWSNEDYSVEILNIVDRGAYNVRPIYLRYKKEYPAEDKRVNVTFTLKDPVKSESEDPEIVNNTPARYVLTLDDILIPRYIIHFDGRGNTGGVMYDRGSQGGDFTFPECDFVRTGYTFKNWEYKNIDTYEPGDSTPEGSGINSNTTIYVKWEANHYKVVFKANGGTGTMADQEYVYDEAKNLRANSYARVVHDWEFVGWNTSANGSGTHFSDGASVSNLTSEPDGLVTLYAQWKRKYYITLKNQDTNIDEGVEKPATGSAITINAVPTRDGWTLDGWYSAKTDRGVKILEANGTVVNDLTVSGYAKDGAFDLNRDVTLYACWKKDNVYVIDNALDQSDDGGVYLVVSKDSDENYYALSTHQSSSSDKKLRSADVVVMTDANDSNLKYVLVANDTEKWKIKYIDVSGYNDANRYTTSYSFFTFNNNIATNPVASNDKYIWQASNMQITWENNLMWQNWISNRTLWTYGVSGSSMLESSFELVEKKRALSMKRNNDGTWQASAGDNKVYLFKEQTIYSFASN